MKKAFSYIRFSTPEQAKGNSLARQLELSQQYAAEHGFELDESLSMRDLGLSGYKGDHLKKGALGLFLEAVRGGVVPKGSVLLVESLDRLSRAEIVPQMNLFLELITAGVTIVTLADRKSYSTASINEQMHDLMYSLMIMSRGHEESATKSRRLKAAWAAKRKSGGFYTSRAPAWLRADRIKGCFEIIPERGAIIRQIFQWAGEGLGHHLIAKRLNEAKEPTWGKSAGWHCSYVQKILLNTAVTGEFQPHRMENGKRVPEGSPVPDYFPRIISDADFYRVRSKRSANATFVGRSSNNGNVFSGLLKCGYTGSSIVYVNKGDTWQYLVSDLARRGRGGRYVSWRYEDFATSFFAFLTELRFADLINEKALSTLRETENAIYAKQGHVATIKKGAANLMQAIIDSPNPPKILTAQIATMEVDQSRLEAELDALKRKLDELQSIQRNAKNLQEENKALIARRDEPEVRERLRKKLREQIAKIELFSEGFPDRVPDNVEDIEFAYGEDDASNILRAEREPINIRSKKLPRGKQERFFKVYFKTGAMKFVKPRFNDSSEVETVMNVTYED